MEVEWSNNKKSQTVQHTNVQNCTYNNDDAKNHRFNERRVREREVAAHYIENSVKHMYINLYRLRTLSLPRHRKKKLIEEAEEKYFATF